MSKRAEVSLTLLTLIGCRLLCGAAEDVPIEIQIEVTEVDHRKASRLGIEWMEKVGFQEASPAGLTAVGRVERITPLVGDLQFLVEEGAAELLANPNLITNAGTVATFHAGGEIPYITSSSLGTSHVEFKTYGVRLEIKPQLLVDGQIELDVKAAVSAPDAANGVLLSGNAVPGLLERSVSSHVTLDSGATMIIAGLVQSQNDKTQSGIPFLRRIPLFGRLFRWEKIVHRRTTVVVFVTPKVVSREN